MNGVDIEKSVYKEIKDSCPSVKHKDVAKILIILGISTEECFKNGDLKKSEKSKVIKLIEKKIIKVEKEIIENEKNIFEDDESIIIPQKLIELRNQKRDLEKQKEFLYA